MKTVTKYQADDGTEFSSEAKALAHEALCTEIAGIVSALPELPKDDGSRFVSGHGYIQHDPAVFWTVRENLLKIAKRFTDLQWIDQAIEDRVGVHPSWPTRAINECCPEPLSEAWYRIYCTDAVTLREYGQPFYASNPEKVEGGRVNP